MLGERARAFGRQPAPRDRSPILELLARRHVACVFQLPHLRAEIAVCLLEQRFQTTERHLLVARQQPAWSQQL